MSTRAGGTDAMPGGLLDALFMPRHVAVYGASARHRAKLGNTLLRNVAAGAPTVAVHPSATSIDGVPAVANLADTDTPVDLALISVPAPAVEDAVGDAASGGARVGVVLSSGFGETGADGRAVEARLVARAGEHGMRLVGPNCMGVVSSRDAAWLNGSYFWSLPERAGSVSFISQSGAFGGMFFAECRARGLGLARFASLGNSIDVVETDVLEALGDDDATGAIGMFVEGFRDGRRFVDVARRVTASKPVVVLKAGKAAAGARAAASHTGSIVGRHAAVSAAFDRAGVIEAATTGELFDVLTAVSQIRPPRGHRVAIVTISGGPGVLAADAAEAAGLELAAPSDATVRAVRELAPGFAALGNPIDLTPQCHPDAFGAAIGAVYDDDRFDAVVVINCGLDIPEFGTGVTAAAQRTGKPTTAFVLDVPTIRKAFDDAGIPCFAAPERAVHALARRASAAELTTNQRSSS